MAFAPGAEHKYLVLITGAPDWDLQFWNWDRPKLLHSLKLSVTRCIYQVEFNPVDYHKGFTITGN